MKEDTSKGSLRNNTPANMDHMVWRLEKAASLGILSFIRVDWIDKVSTGVNMKTSEIFRDKF